MRVALSYFESWLSMLEDSKHIQVLKVVHGAHIICLNGVYNFGLVLVENFYKIYYITLDYTMAMTLDINVLCPELTMIDLKELKMTKRPMPPVSHSGIV